MPNLQPPDSFRLKIDGYETLINPPLGGWKNTQINKVSRLPEVSLIEVLDQVGQLGINGLISMLL